MASLDNSRLDEEFDLLTHPHRRYVLYHLRRESEAVEIGTLATAIAEWDGDQTGPDRSTDIREVETTLHHVHLPKLADAGVITYSADRGYVELGEIDGLDQFLGDTARIDGYTRSTADD